MTALRVMWIGGAGARGIDPYRWGHLVFPLKEWVVIDPEQEENGDRRKFAEHVLRKVATHTHFRTAPVESKVKVRKSQLEEAMAETAATQAEAEARGVA